MQLEELINLIVSGALFLYLARLKPGLGKLVPPLWIAGMILVLVSNLATVLETFIWTQPLNIVEHLSFTLATILFFAGSFSYGRESD